eukprot:4896055-Pleurochrysis_carterae.AAC.2
MLRRSPGVEDIVAALCEAMVALKKCFGPKKHATALCLLLEIHAKPAVDVHSTACAILLSVNSRLAVACASEGKAVFLCIPVASTPEASDGVTALSL